MDLFRLRSTAPVRMAIALLVYLLLGSPVLLAQATSSGTIIGTVTDASGAIVPGAAVTVTDVSTKAERKTVSNHDGQYLLNDVLPGTYTVTVMMPGFSTGKISNLIVSVGTQSTANFKLAVGAESTTISVEASTVDLQTINASTGQTVDPMVVAALPAVNRDVSTFATLQPGVTPGGNVAGTTSDQATFQLDGGSNSSDMDGTSSSYTVQLAGSTTGGFSTGGTPTSGVMPMPQDSVEEFKVTTTGQTADFNNSSGGQVQVVTKRGHDQWHGTAYEYYLDSNIGANTWDNNFQNAYTPKPSYHYSRYGVSAGGPILPKLFGGKTYFFANYEGFRFPSASTYERTVPSYEFGQLHEIYANGAFVTPATLQANDPRGQGYNTDMMGFYNQYLPVPSSPAADNGASPYTGGTFDQSCGALLATICDGKNFIGYKGTVHTPQNSDFGVARIDHDFGEKWHIMASFRYYDLRNLTSAQVDIGGAIAGDKIGVPAALNPYPQKPWFFVTGVTTNISPSLTNDFHYSYLRNYWQWFGPGAPALFPGAGGAVEPLGEYATTVLSPINVNSTAVRTRTWDGKDNFLSDNLSKLKGDHFIQFGGQYQHNYNFHLRTDNGTTVNNTPTYQIGDSAGGGALSYSIQGLGATATAAPSANTARIVDAYFGIVTDSQVVNAYTPNSTGVLQLQPPATPEGAHSVVPYYNLYATDTWHVKPSLTLNYGLSWALEMPPTERNGNQVMFTDASGKAIYLQQWLDARKSAAMSGQIYNPTVGFARLPFVDGGTRKYMYDPYYASFSPRISFAWNPKFNSPGLSRIFGNGATVIRGGYGRIYGRINGDIQLLNPLLSPGLLLGTQCQNITIGGTCSAAQLSDKTAFRFGPAHDGVAPTLASAPVPQTLPNIYRPGIDGPGVAIASPVDPSFRPDNVDTFNFSIQRQLNRKMMVEVGYIGRLIHNEEVLQNPNAIPYMLSQGGQTFQSAYLAIENAFGCTISAGQCLKSTTPTTFAAQPFFETALAGTSYCGGTNANCTTGVAKAFASQFRGQQIFKLWQALDTASATATGTGWTFPRSLMGTPVSGTYGAAGQLVSGISVATSAGYGNYHGGYVTFKTSGFHGLTAVENFTLSKALGLGSINQSTNGSSTATDSFNLQQQYGRQTFDQKVIFNTLLVYETPWYKSQAGIVGRLAGGWVLSPVVVAGTGVPLRCTNFTGSQSFGGVDNSGLSDRSSCVFTTPYKGSYHTNRGVTGGTDAYGNSIATSVKGNGSAAVNMFLDPVAVWNTVRPAILGLDARNGGPGPISGLGYLNMDLSVKKTLIVWEKTSLEFSGSFYNVMNHLDFSNPSLALSSPTAWGVTKTQGNTPRQIQMGVRANF